MHIGFASVLYRYKLEPFARSEIEMCLRYLTRHAPLLHAMPVRKEFQGTILRFADIIPSMMRSIHDVPHCLSTDWLSANLNQTCTHKLARGM